MGLFSCDKINELNKECLGEVNSFSIYINLPISFPIGVSKANSKEIKFLKGMINIISSFWIFEVA